MTAQRRPLIYFACLDDGTTTTHQRVTYLEYGAQPHLGFMHRHLDAFARRGLCFYGFPDSCFYSHTVFTQAAPRSYRHADLIMCA
mmetsp:Transcript_19908/g.45927  ORF Transcript_19908/g.45927 Transcript_19908/m.45927 type:complete len:85 (-) Transcript_19908:552-806(-)